MALVNIVRKERTYAIDTVQFRKVLDDGISLDMSPEGLMLETNNNPSAWQKLQIKLGCFMDKLGICDPFNLYRCAGDAAMNAGLTDIATYIYTDMNYVSVGTSSSDPTVYTKTNLVAPVLTRVLATKGYETTNVANDTATFTGIFTPDGIYTIVETGLHKTLSGADMRYRQTSCSITTANGAPFGIIWKVAVVRG